MTALDTACAHGFAPDERPRPRLCRVDAAMDPEFDRRPEPSKRFDRTRAFPNGQIPAEVQPAFIERLILDPVCHARLNGGRQGDQSAGRVNSSVVSQSDSVGAL